MIRINLLPFRAARKKENIRRQLSIYVLSVVFLAVIMGYYFLDFYKKIGALEAKKAEKQKELATYAKTTKKIAELKKKVSEVRTKLNAIKDLEKKKTGPVRMLDEIATAVPRDKLWLKSFTENKGILTLAGSAMDNDTVAVFMTNLEKTEHITSVDLKSTTLRKLPKHKLNVSDFVLSCKIYSFEEKQKPKTTQKK